MKTTIWNKFPDLEKELEQVQSIITDEIQVPEANFEQGIEQLVTGNGKMLRAALVLISGHFGKVTVDRQKLLKAAASIEVIHLASLVHDDVIDQSDLRRGESTLNSQFGQREAIYLGDYLFTKYFEMLLDYAPSFDNLRYNVESMKDVLFGELAQDVSKFDLDRSEQDYFDSIQGKTAELFKVAMGEGAILSQADQSTIQVAEKIGLNFGMAFQIRDDLLDFEPVIETEKPTLHDASEGVYTLPVIEALKTADAPQLKKILKKDQLDKADLKQIVEIVSDSGGMKAARQIYDQYLDDAFHLIAKLPQSESTVILKTIISELFQSSK
ncbi:polyprenyl synthetase family protein [Fructilactobacillus fructivorans]|uniref:Polyprenyl synthetase family protein n=1 Tax=Fructilactobacillus fructivorans TaxID=1614 RepID=A0AAE6TVK9_9LACO|nr:polyprenyl synthetase family protein [Fructilactobacillus fructivorans]KRK58148.1 trans-hexaprenyltranstransferase, component II [Fructilactobacillus fructivorans]QFX92146.1 polyprenyl synthetase family protein [Fructilactobacillus fructivorans]RDV65194.1 polyprenyl synthetase family protein [Fructilactobacillus fructivorans]